MHKLAGSRHLEIDPAVPVVSLVARLVNSKRHVDILDALVIGKIDDVALFAGAGPGAATVVRAVEERKLDNRVIMLGSLPRDRVRDVLAASNVLCCRRPPTAPPSPAQSYGRRCPSGRERHREPRS